MEAPHVLNECPGKPRRPVNSLACFIPLPSAKPVPTPVTPKVITVTPKVIMWRDTCYKERESSQS